MGQLTEVRKERFGGAVGSAKMTADKLAYKLKTAGTHGDSSNSALRRVREAARDKDRGGVIGKADRDQNSSVSATVVLRKPKGAHIKGTTTAQTRSGSFAGKSRGVGRHLGRDQNSSPGSAKVRTPTLREINGKFAGQGPGVKVFHPTFSSTHRAPRDTSLQHWTKGGDKVSRPWVSKSDDAGKGRMAPIEMVNLLHHTGARVGRRIELETEGAVEKAVVPTHAVSSGFARLGSTAKNPGVKARAVEGLFRQNAARGIGTEPSATTRLRAIGEHNSVARAKSNEAGNRINRGQLSSPSRKPYLNTNWMS